MLHVLLLYLRNSQCKEGPLVAVLSLHLDLLVHFLILIINILKLC